MRMQISDMLGQYNRNVTNGTEELRGAQSAQKMVSTVGDLAAGNIFEGTVNQVKGGKVTLALGNGQVLTARLDGKVDIRQGSSMFFQVKSNDGTTVSIRPYTGAGNTGNPTLLNALSAAQVPVTERSLMMVDAMMQEQMPIDRQSILDMAKLISSNPNANVQTVVQMAKLGLPVTEAMASQYENYLSDRHALLGQMDLAVNQIMGALGDNALSPEEAFALYNRIADILLADDGTAKPVLAEQTGMQAAGAEQTVGNVQDAALLPGGEAGGVQTADAGQNAAKISVAEPGMAEPGVAQTNGEQSAAQTPEAVIEGGMARQAMDPNEIQGAAGREQTAVLNGAGEAAAREQTAVYNGAGEAAMRPGEGLSTTLGSLLSGEQLAALAKAVGNVPTLVGNPNLFVDGTAAEIFVDTLQEELPGAPALPESVLNAQEAVLNKDMTAGEFLRAVQTALAQNSQYGFAGAQRLFAGKEFQALLKDVVEQQWLVKPQELKENHKLSALYEKMETQVRQLADAIRATGTSQNSFLQTASDIRGNLEFMNQMNQIYHYVQMPLKMSGQNANGELYVYSNRKRLEDPDAELTAFLHLDLESLGETDVSVRMKDRQVKTNFYFEDDASYDLVEKHLPILEKRLKNKGYNCTISITNEKKAVNFKENFVKKGKAPAVSLHRYSFDVKA